MKTSVEWATALVDARPTMIGNQAREDVIASLASIVKTIQEDAYDLRDRESDSRVRIAAAALLSHISVWHTPPAGSQLDLICKKLNDALQPRTRAGGES